jgi:hypothetical protein
MKNNHLNGVAGHLAIVQFLLATTWIVYVIYLGDMLEQVGIGRDKLLWFILFDQLLFAVMDILMGIGSDRAGRLMRRLGPLILGINTVSCLGFAALPWLAGNAAAGGVQQGLWIAALMLWIATSSVLRAPAFKLLTRHAAAPQLPALVALSLTGMALGAAIGPYLGVVLNAVDPLLPFLITAATLWLSTAGLIYAERRAGDHAQTDAPAAEVADNPNLPYRLLILYLAGAALLLALGFQLHSFINSKPNYLQFVEPAQLVWVMPVFWIGFNLLVIPGRNQLSKAPDPFLLMLLAIPPGVLMLWLNAHSPGLNSLIIAQLLAGGAWGILLTGGVSAALMVGGKRRGGLVLGIWFSMLAVGALLRVLIVLNEVPSQTEFADWLVILPPLCWAMAGGCLYLARRAWRSGSES